MARLAFTLIELLVVIAIVVVLLAVLAPALDRAVYQAELVRCATGQRGSATGVLGYAFDHNRRFPHRGPYRNGFGLARANMMKIRGQVNDLDLILDYVPLKMLVDPLTGGLTAADLDERQDLDSDSALLLDDAVW